MGLNLEYTLPKPNFVNTAPSKACQDTTQRGRKDSEGTWQMGH